jgi:hypothetical protein
MPYGIPIRDRTPDRGIVRLVVVHTQGVIDRCAEVVGGEVRVVVRSVTLYIICPPQCGSGLRGFLFAQIKLTRVEEGQVKI